MDVDEGREGAGRGCRRLRMEVGHRGAVLRGVLDLPHHPAGLVVFAEGYGGTTSSPRAAVLARHFTLAGLAVLRMDLVHEAEALDPCHVHDVEVLADRLERAVLWAAHCPATEGLRPCLLGAGVGAAAALLLAARPDSGIEAVVCSRGRPDLAGEHLADVHVPVLLLADLPKRGGFSTLQEVRSRLGSARTALIVLHRTDLAPTGEQEPALIARTVVGWLRTLPQRYGAIPASRTGGAP